MATTVGPYSPIMRAGDFLICSGQLGLAEGVLAEGVGAQVHQALRNVSTLLASKDSGLHEVVKTTVLLADINDFAEVNEAYAAHFSERPPARTAFATAGLPLGALVEIEAWAYAPGSSAGLL
ncbi:MAG: Rid family hydrolase [Acidimicrobiales bacterium]|jgi:2-iminobutanoate/2-iminopropanoate deaminase